MRFLIDANLPRSIVVLVSGLGHDVEFARDIGLGAAPDREVANHAKASAAALITRDMDFADVRRYPPDEYAGLVVLRIPDSFTAAEIAHVVERFLREPGFVAQLSGRLAIVEVDRVRFRPPLL
jgi:predicted nuclease of predicted toxin-antitoxin system